MTLPAPNGYRHRPQALDVAARAVYSTTGVPATDVPTTGSHRAWEAHLPAARQAWHATLTDRLADAITTASMIPTDGPGPWRLVDDQQAEPDTATGAGWWEALRQFRHLTDGILAAAHCHGLTHKGEVNAAAARIATWARPEDTDPGTVARLVAHHNQCPEVALLLTCRGSFPGITPSIATGDHDGRRLTFATLCSAQSTLARA